MNDTIMASKKIRVLKRLLSGMASIFWHDDSEMVLRYAGSFQGDDKGMPLITRLSKDLLKRGINSKELFLLYQPIVSLKNGAIYGMEVFIRWQHPKFGLIKPVEFIPIAEEYELMMPIGRWVLEQACVVEEKWKKEGLISKAFHLSVNLTASQLNSKTFLEHIMQVTNTTGIEIKTIDFDFGQGYAANESVALIPGLKDHGLNFALDDCGTHGIIDMDWIKWKGFRTIKLDRPLIGQMKNNENIETYIINLLRNAKKHGIITLAEGVENKEQLDFLKKHGCDFAQGFYFSEPISEKDFGLLLKGHKILKNIKP